VPEDRLPGLEKHAFGGALERPELFFRQVAKEMDPAQGLRISHERLLTFRWMDFIVEEVSAARQSRQ